MKPIPKRVIIAKHNETLNIDLTLFSVKLYSELAIGVWATKDDDEVKLVKVIPFSNINEIEFIYE